MSNPSISNTQLWERVEKLGKFVHTFLDEIISQKLEAKDRATAAYGKAKEISVLPEFQAVLAIMKATPEVNRFEGKQVGAADYGYALIKGDERILNLLVHYFAANINYETGSFQNAYIEFESFYYRSTFATLAWSHLHNFELNCDRIDLSDEISIVKDDKLKSELSASRRSNRSTFRDISLSSFIIQRRYNRKLIVVNSPNENRSVERTDTCIEIFDNVISTLRILKPGSVYREQSISKEYNGFIHDVRSTVTLAYEHVVTGSNYEMNNTEVELLCKIFKTFSGQPSKGFILGARRLSLGLERRNNDDKLLDFIIGLEAMYLPDENNELSYRLSLRVAFTLRKNNADRQEVFQFMRKMYKERSNIAHGNKVKLTHDDVSKVESILRESLKLYIDSPRKFLAQISEGGTRRDGPLNTVFFE